MTPERWARIDQLLDEAMARLPRERAAFLEAACDGDDELRREVESLLAAHQKADEKFLQLPALEVAAKRLAGGGEHSLIGQSISHYTVVSILGVGGMGEVYLARDTRLERKVALKFLPPQYTQDPTRIRRFEREARAVSALNHPNILTIYEIGEIEDKHFIAAEFIDGQTLRQLLLHGRVAMANAVEISIQIASALAAAHEAGIIHRDIKPENVMLRRDGYAKVLDFGLAKLTERRHSHLRAMATGATNASEGDIAVTNPGAVLGTIRYMSPEQALGQEVDARSDIFSLGVLLYELTTGAPPFKGHSTAATLDAIAHHQPVPVTQLRPDLHPELERIVGRALEKDRELRYQTAADLRADLKRLGRELDSLSHAVSAAESRARATPPDQPPVWWKRKASLAAAVLALLVLLAVAMTLGWRLWADGTKMASPWDGADQTQITDFPGEELFPSLSPDGKTIVYARRGREGDFDIWSQRVGGVNVQNLTADRREHDTQPAFSPDGKWIAFRSERDGGGIFVMGASGESVRRLAGNTAYHPAWSPDGKEIIYTEESVSDPRSRNLVPRKLWAMVIETGQARLIKEHDIAQPSWSPNGYRIAYWGQHRDAQRDIWTIPAQGGEPVAVTDDAATDWNPVWSPDGKYLYFASDRTRVMSLWRVPIDERTGRTLGKPELVPTPSVFSQHISFSRDGRQLAFVDLRPRFRLASVAFDPAREVVTAREDFIIAETSWRTYYPDVSPDGKWLVYNATVGNREDLYLVRTDGAGQPQKLTDDDDKDRYPRWSPDGNRIAFFSNRDGRRWQIWMINRDGSGRQQVTATDDGEAFFPNWSPTGDRLAYTIRLSASPGTAMFVVDLSQTLPAAGERLPYDQQIRFWPRDWSADGKRIIGGWRAKLGALELTKAYSLETNQFEDVSNSAGQRQAWFGDGHRAISLGDGNLFVVDPRTGRKDRELLSRPPYQLTWFTLPRDGRTLYFAQDISEANVWVLNQK